MIDPARKAPPGPPEANLHEPKRMVIACPTVITELLPFLPATVGYRVLDFALHSNADRLREMLQDAVDAASEEADEIMLGYGLCASGLIGVRATTATLVVPRVDDCIGIFLGSHRAYRMQRDAEPGTYYLTKGWIDAGDGPFGEYKRLAERHGSKRADQLVRLMLENYTRLALIDTGHYDLAPYRAFARQTADQFGLRYQEIQGSTALVRKLVEGPWDDDFVIARPGDCIEYDDFWTHDESHGPVYAQSGVAIR